MEIPFEIVLSRSIKSIENNDTLRQVELVGSPVSVIYRKPVRDMSPKFYRKNFYPTTVKEALMVIGYDAILVEKFVSSPVSIDNVRDWDAEGEGGLKLDHVVYEQAIQFLRERVIKDYERQITIIGRQPFKYYLGTLLLNEHPESHHLNGLAQVVVLSRSVRYKDYFKLGKEVIEFDGDFTKDGLAKKIFEELFREVVAEKAKEIEESKKIKIQGILVGNIKAERVSYASLSISARAACEYLAGNPKQKFVLGASYLV